MTGGASLNPQTSRLDNRAIAAGLYDSLKLAAIYVAAGAAFGCIAFLAIELTRGDGRIAMVWIPNAVAVAAMLVVGLLVFLNKTRMGRAIRALGDDHQAALSVGISLQTIWVLVWFIAGIIALVTGIAWGARAGVSFALEVIAYKALPVLMLGGLESITGAIIGGLMIGLFEKLFEIYWGQPLLGGNTETWFAFVLALFVLLFRPQGLFGERIIERV